MKARPEVIVEPECKGISALYILVYWDGKRLLNLIRDEVRMVTALVNKSDLLVDSSKIHCIEDTSAASGKTPCKIYKTVNNYFSY